MTIKGRHKDPEPDTIPAANAYSLGSDFGVDGAGASIKGRHKDKKDELLPGNVLCGVSFS